MTALSRPVELLMAKAIIGPFIKLASMTLRKAISEGEKLNGKLEGKIHLACKRKIVLFCNEHLCHASQKYLVDDFLSEIETHL